jgi:methionyl-tRNA formyltransferase
MSQITVTENVRQAPRVLFFGMPGNFSAPILATLLQHGINVCAVVLPAISRPGIQPAAIQRRLPPRALRSVLPLVREGVPADFLQVATVRRVPIWEVSRLASSETIEVLAGYQPDLICVACFSLRVPRAILTLPPLGCLNVHPSLLPANRGPVPLFWALHEGRTTTGVTIHEMTEKMDCGPILAQETLPIPDGSRYDQLEARCAELGGKLLARTVRELSEGRVTRVPQDESRSSYQSFPTAEDFVLNVASWGARHLYNFIRGVRNWEFPLVLHTAAGQILVHDAISFGHEEVPPTFEQDRGVRLVRCRAGWVCVLCHYQDQPVS